MGGKMKFIFDDKIRVSVPKDYEVYEKDFPAKLKESEDYNKYYWVGNFGFRKIKGGEKKKGNFGQSYTVQVKYRKNRPNKKLVYWNGKKTKKLSGTKVNVKKVKYKTAKLKMGDPPVGWVN